MQNASELVIRDLAPSLTLFTTSSTSTPPVPLIYNRGHLSNQERGCIYILLKGLHVSDLGVKCEKYVKEGLEKLKVEKAKNFSGLAITLRSQSFRKVACISLTLKSW